MDRRIKLERLMYIMCKINPLLKRIQKEQKVELEVEATTLGKQFCLMSDIIRQLLNSYYFQVSSFRAVGILERVFIMYLLLFVGKALKEEDIKTTGLDQDDRIYWYVPILLACHK